MSYIFTAFNRERTWGKRTVFYVRSGICSETFGFKRHIVHEVVHMQNIAGSKDAVYICHVMLVNVGTAGSRIQLNARFQGEFIFGNQSYGKYQGIA